MDKDIILSIFIGIIVIATLNVLIVPQRTAVINAKETFLIPKKQSRRCKCKL